MLGVKFIACPDRWEQKALLLFPEQPRMRYFLRFVVALIPILGVVASRADERPVYTLNDLSNRSWCELEGIYRSAVPGAAPCGFYRGHVVFRPHDFLAGPRSAITNYSWQGKHFENNTLINQFRGVRMIRANVAPGESWLDGRPAHILDYQKTSLLWFDVRDETREVSPGVYVGAMYLRRFHEPKLKVLFILEAEPCGERPCAVQQSVTPCRP